jgi:YaiO family outer membrane protein
VEHLKTIDNVCNAVISSGVEKVRKLKLLLKPAHFLDFARNGGTRDLQIPLYKIQYRSLPILKIWILAGLFFCTTQKVSAQVNNVDSAFQVARTLAFSSNYKLSIALCKKVLEKSPNYQDVQVLLGRVYFWNDQTDSAIFILQQSLESKPYEDAYIALSDILRWEKRSMEAQKIAADGLRSFPASEELLIRKIKALDDLENYKGAYHLADSLVNKNNNAELRRLVERIKNKMAKNIFGVSYDIDYFDKQFKDPWHLLALSYGRQTKYLGKVSARVNVANRFATNGSQFELDAYPSLDKKTYAYINAGFSPDAVFPDYRGGLSIYRNFSRAFEGEVGVRLLYFSKTTILYVGSIGKYAGNFWFSLRPTFIASENGNRFSQSYSFVTRYYFNTSFDFLTLTVAYGLSPDDRSKETLLQNPDLKSSRIQLGIQKLVKRATVFTLSTGIVRGEFIQGSLTVGNDLFIGIGYQKMF